MSKKIGVLGGIGPEATAEFYSKLIKKLQKSGMVRSNTDFPQIIINSIPAPELVGDEISSEELLPYKEGLKMLDKLGVDFIAMVCNTIHLFLDELQKEIAAPITDLKEGVHEALKEKGISSVLVLGTSVTINKGLYVFQNMEYFKPDEREISELSNAILDFTAHGKNEAQCRKVRSICQKYLDAGAGAVVLGCTELATMLEDEDIPKINTIDVLVDIVVEKLADD